MPSLETQVAATPNRAGGIAPRNRLDSLRLALDEIRQREESAMGDEDVRQMRATCRFSGVTEVVGRLLIHFSFEPIAFILGVFVLFIHKQVASVEIGHTILHGTYDKIDPSGRFNSKTWRWRNNVDTEAWRNVHNVQHHYNTNVAGKDPDIHFGSIRLTDQTPYNGIEHRFQMFLTLFFLFPNFNLLMNLHVTGVVDFFHGNGRDSEFDIIKDRSEETRREVRKRAIRGFLGYHLYEFVLWPALAGSMWWKVILGNWIAEVMKNVYTAATIFCGHVGEYTATYDENTRASGRGEWYKMQIESSNNFHVPWALSVLCGGLDCHIEHHLYPKLPPARLRRIAPEVRAICQAHDVTYRISSWPSALMASFERLIYLSRDSDGRFTTNLVHAIEAMD